MPYKSFRGGIHPLRHEGKRQTRNIQISEEISGSVVIPMAMHLGAPAKPCVSKGDRVLMGQLIGEPQGALGLPVHSSISGTVIGIDERRQLGSFPVQCVEIENDLMDESVEFTPLGGVDEVDPALIIPAIKNAGICGMGGATFPTHIKLSVPAGKRCDTFILNGAECETHMTSDFRLMVENTKDIIDGLRICMRALNVENGIICIENNKPEAIKLMREMTSEYSGIRVMVLQTKYPQGSEKQLIKSVTGLEVPRGKLPIDIGVIVLNVATAYAIFDAITTGRPLMSRITTVTGAVNKPLNLRVRIGTRISDAIGACDGYMDNPGKIIAGGAMTGVCVPHDDISITKGMGGIVVLGENASNMRTESPCIRCARCVRVCPVGLRPYALKSACVRNDRENAKKDNVKDCITCGCCSFICPAAQYLTPAFKSMKERIIAEERQGVK